MAWNLRVISRPDPSGLAHQFGIHEVYYNSTGRIEVGTEEPCGTFGEPLAELQADMQITSEALSKPVLSETGLLQDLARQPEQRRSRASLDEEGTSTPIE